MPSDKSEGGSPVIRYKVQEISDSPSQTSKHTNTESPCGGKLDSAAKEPQIVFKGLVNKSELKEEWILDCIRHYVDHWWCHPITITLLNAKTCLSSLFPAARGHKSITATLKSNYVFHQEEGSDKTHHTAPLNAPSVVLTEQQGGI